MSQNIEEIDGSFPKTLHAIVVLPGPLFPDRSQTVNVFAGLSRLEAAIDRNKTLVSLNYLSPPTINSLYKRLSGSRLGENEFPRIVFFSALANEGSLILEDDLGRADLITADELCGNIRSALQDKSPIDICLLRTIGSSWGLPEQLVSSNTFKVVVNLTSGASDEDAMSFAATFFDALIRGESTERAVLGARGLAQRVGATIIGDGRITVKVFPGGEPRISAGRPTGRLPPRKAFFGRANALVELAEKFAQAENSVIVVNGPPGIGKSALVTEAVHRAAWRFPGGVTWFSAPMDATLAQRLTAPDVFADLARTLDLATDCNQPTEADILTHFTKYPSLVVLDGTGTTVTAPARPAKGA